MAQQKEQQNASDKHKPGLASHPHSLTLSLTHTHTHIHTHVHAHAVLSWLFYALDKWFHGLLRLKLSCPNKHPTGSKVTPKKEKQDVKLEHGHGKTFTQKW